MQPFVRSRMGAVISWLILALAVAAAPTPILAAENWLAASDSIVYAVDTTTDGAITVAGRRDNTVIAYGSDGEELWSFPTQGTVYGVAISRDGSRIAVASEDRHVYLLDGDGNEIWNYRGTQTFLSVSISGDGQVVVAGSEDRAVTYFDTAGAVVWQYAASDHVNQVAVYGSAKGFRVVVGTRDSRVTLVSGDGQRMWEKLLSYTVRAVDVNNKGSLIVVGDARGALSMLDGTNGTVLWEATIGNNLSGVSITGDGSTVVAGSSNGIFAVFDSDGNELQRDQPGGVFNDVAISGDGSAIAVARDDGAALYARGDDGKFTLPKASSQYQKYLWPLVVGGAIVVLALGVLGSRTMASGERAWQGAARSSRGTLAEIWDARISYIFLFPTIVLLLIFNYYPAISGIYHAFTEWSPGLETKWVGLDQFRDLRNNRYFWTGIGNLILLIVTAFLKLLIPLIVAEMIFHLQSGKLAYGFRTLFVLQVIVPGVVGVLLWVNVYDPNIGILNQVLRAIGLEGLTRSWLGDANTAMGSIIFMGFPWVSAFALLIFYGGLISIPSELFDSAALDGASVFRRILNIDLPLLLGQIRLLVILTFIATVQEFAAIFLTTGGGPGSATYVPSLELYYQAVRFNNFGGAAAIGAVLFLVILAGTIINLRYVKSSVEYSA